MEYPGFIRMYLGETEYGYFMYIFLFYQWFTLFKITRDDVSYIPDHLVWPKYQYLT